MKTLVIAEKMAGKSGTRQVAQPTGLLATIPITRKEA